MGHPLGSACKQQLIPCHSRIASSNFPSMKTVANFGRLIGTVSLTLQGPTGKPSELPEYDHLHSGSTLSMAQAFCGCFTVCETTSEGLSHCGNRCANLDSYSGSSLCLCSNIEVSKKQCQSICQDWQLLFMRGRSRPPCGWVCDLQVCMQRFSKWVSHRSPVELRIACEWGRPATGAMARQVRPSL